jgi:multimeric flavodoxin WrbA
LASASKAILFIAEKSAGLRIMKILGIMGSPRKGGNTDLLMDVALEEAGKNGLSAKRITLADKRIAPCDGCLKCSRTGRCVIQDDMQEVYGAMVEAKGIIWATPVYYWSMSAQTKAAMDRTYALTFPTLQLANKIGGLIVVAGNRGCTNTTNIFHMYFNYNHMFSTEVAYGYAREKGEIQGNFVVMKTVQEMVRQMIGLMGNNLKYADEFQIPMPRYIRKKYPP